MLLLRRPGAAGSRGALTAEINPEPTPASARVDLALAGPAEEVLDRVERELSGNRSAQTPPAGRF